jgi:hypothetical protein
MVSEPASLWHKKLNQMSDFCGDHFVRSFVTISNSYVLALRTSEDLITMLGPEMFYLDRSSKMCIRKLGCKTSRKEV